MLYQGSRVLGQAMHGDRHARSAVVHRQPGLVGSDGAVLERNRDLDAVARHRLQDLAKTGGAGVGGHRILHFIEAVEAEVGQGIE